MNFAGATQYQVSIQQCLAHRLNKQCSSSVQETTLLIKQAGLSESLLSLVARIAQLQYPEFAQVEEIPLIICLPAGIHPYNRTSGYFDNSANAIVLYQEYGRAVLRGSLDDLNLFVAHELAHWYQCRALGESLISTVNIHRKRSWMEACYVATTNLWPELGLERNQFNPLISTRDRETGKVRKKQRDGAMSDVQLHHWPHSLIEFAG